MFDATTDDYTQPIFRPGPGGEDRSMQLEAEVSLPNQARLVTLTWALRGPRSGPFDIARRLTQSEPWTSLQSNVPGNSYVENSVSHGQNYEYPVTLSDDIGPTAHVWTHLRCGQLND